MFKSLICCNRFFQKISKKLSDCINYIHAVHFHSFEESESSAKYYHMSSFGESKAEKLATDDDKSKEFVKYNARQISRIYPGAKRQDSSNLKPIQFWNAGCQIGMCLGDLKKFYLQITNMLFFSCFKLSNGRQAKHV